MSPTLQRLRLKLDQAINFGKSPTGAFAIAVLGVLLAVYATWFNDKKPQMAYALAFEESVLSPYAEGENISLLLNGKAIDADSSLLAILYVRLWNTGDVTLRPPDFDTKYPLGLRIAGGTVLTAKVDSASNDYLKSALVAGLTTPTTIAVTPAILEPRDSFVVKALVRKASKESQLQVKPIGKIAGVSGFDEYYPRTAERPDIIIGYRSVSLERLIFFGGLGLVLLNLIYSIYRWIQKRRIATRNQSEVSHRDDA